MAENHYDKFEKWKNNEKENNTEQIDAKDIIGDVYEEVEESGTDNIALEQVSRDLFDVADISETDDEQESGLPDESDNESDGGKTSFTELRQGKKVPRLKKNMVLAIMVGGVFVFLFVINMFLQKNEEQKQYFEGKDNNIKIGSDFSLGDLVRRPARADKDYQTAESAEFYLRTPPAYEPAPAYAAAPESPGKSGAVTANNSSRVNFSESDLLAMKAKIGKDGGYGFAVMPANYETQAVAGFSNTQTGAAMQIPTQEEYTRQRLGEIAQFAQTAQTAQAAGSNGRTNTDILNNGRFSDAGKYNPDNSQAGTGTVYLNDNCLFPGTIIHAVLVSRIDTDYPGPIHARVTENVYDSMTGKNLLIPQGTILQGNYSSSSIGVAKVQIAWESMVVNYSGVAYQTPLGGMAGVDKRGRAGIAGTLDEHYFEWLKAAGIVSLFTMLNSEVAYQTKGQNNPQIRELMDINQGIVNNLGNRLMERALNIQPTVRVANGTAVSVSVNAPLALRVFPAIKAEEKYIRR